MKIHSDIVTRQDITRVIGLVPGVSYLKLEEKGSRSRARAFDLTLESNGTPDQHGTGRTRRVNAGTSQGLDRFHLPFAASWADWGHVLGALFVQDPYMVTPYYKDASDFHAQTNGVFRS